jgi:hypothetical protein
MASTVLGQGQAESTKGDLKELGDILLGEWTAKSTVDIDIEGICKKGDEYVAEVSYEWVSNVALLEKWVFKVDDKTVVEGVGLTAFDAPKSQIRGAYFDSLGGSWQRVWRKRGNRFVNNERGVFGDGRKSVGRSILSGEKGADTITAKLVDAVLGEEELPEKVFVYKRVKK